MHAKFIKSFSLAFFLTFVILINFVYWIDPLQLIRKASYTPIYMQHSRYQVPALARTQDYDSVIIGTSHTENFKPSLIQGILGWNTLKLSIPAATIHEQILVLNLALERKIVKNVMWGIDIPNLNNYKVDAVQEYCGPFPHHLYKDVRWALPKYLMNPDVVRMSVEIFLREAFHLKDKVYKSSIENVDLYNNWNDTYKKLVKPNEMRDFDRLQGSEKVSVFNQKEITKYISKRSDSNLKANLENITKLIRSHPEVNFFIFCPPYSISFFRALHKSDQLNNFLATQFFVFQELLNYKNVYLYGFLDREDIIMNLNNYKDFSHYWQEINDEIVSCINKDDNRLVDKQSLVNYSKAICRLVNKSNNLASKDGPP